MILAKRLVSERVLRPGSRVASNHCTCAPAARASNPSHPSEGHTTLTPHPRATCSRT